MTLISVGLETHRGMQRKENQDYAAYRALDDNCFSQKGTLLVLADGMGGHAGGSVASKIAVDTLMRKVKFNRGVDVVKALKWGFLKANDLILAQSRKDPSLKGMGTTLTAMVIQNNQLFFAHVGDSRGYLISGKKIQQLTEDHTYVAELLKQGFISAKEAVNHPYDNIITRAIGVSANPVVDHCIDAYTIRSKQAVVICSDGLHKCVSNQEIFDAVKNHTDPSEACHNLILTANKRGGPDNITVIIALINHVDAKRSWFHRWRSV